MPGGVVTSALKQGSESRWPGALQRLWVWLNRDSLDRALAGGANPSESVELSMRAGQLLDRRQREEIAITIEALLDLAGRRDRLYLGFSRIPIDRERIEASRAELERLAEILRGPRYGSPRGVAMARRLVTDFRGPIYTSGRITRLPERLADTLAALEA
jgi:hypothetical protein